MNYLPHIKDRGFNPSPIAGNIPYYADSISNPKCIDTSAHQEFWEEQTYYCLNGYITGGLFIPGIYYHFLNFKIIDGHYGLTYPDFIDLQYDLFLFIHNIKIDDTKLGAIIPKARQKGLSFCGTEIIDYGLKFTDKYRAGVASGLQSHVDKFKSKLYRTYNSTVPEFKSNHLRKGDKEFTLGYEEFTAQGYQTVETGTVLFETMSDDARKLEGETLNDYIAEEVGEFPLAEESIISIKPAQKRGSRFMGKTWCWGTGGKMSKGGKTFANLYHSAESHSLEKFFIPGKRYYPPHVRANSETKIETPYLDAQYPDCTDEQLLGCEDIQAAEEALQRLEETLLKNPDKTKLIQHKQDFPKSVEDVFLSSGTNNFNTDLLYSQAYNIQSEASSRWKEYFLDFVKNKDGDFVIPYQVIAKAAEPKHKKWERVGIYLHPDPNYKNLDIVGVDGYNQDKVTTTRSLGGITVVRRNDILVEKNPKIEEPGKIPICKYFERPPRKEIFWEMALKIAIYYEAIRNTMIGADADLIIQYFKEMGARKYLSPRPKTFDSPDSKQNHDYGVKMTLYSKPRMVGLLQSFVEDNVQYIWFLDLIQDLASYDAENVGTDWDLADSLGHALMRIEDMRNKKVKNIEEEKKNNTYDDLPVWGDDGNGNIIRIQKKSTYRKVGNDVHYTELPSCFRDNLT